MPSPRRARLQAALAVLLAGAVSACDMVRDDARSILAETEGAGPSTAGPTVARADLSVAAEAVSLLGEPLHPLELDSVGEALLRAQLDQAEAARRADPDDPGTLVWLGRRMAYLGQYRQAIDVFTRGIDLYPEDPRFYRHRGHRFITVRRLDRAIEDLEHAARIISGTRDQIEPDGQPNPAGIPRSTLHTNVWYHLGLARYVAGDFVGAEHAFRQGYGISQNDDMRVAMADWLWLSLRRLGRDAEAAALLDDVLADSLEILENEAYRRRLRLYHGDLEPDSLLPPGSDALAVATYGYGLGTWYLLQGDTTTARAIYDDLLATGYWPAFGFLAAEAELVRFATSKE